MPTCWTSGTDGGIWASAAPCRVRFGKGRRLAGADDADGAGDQPGWDVLDWRMSDVRHQFVADYACGDGPMLPRNGHRMVSPGESDPRNC